MIILKYECNNVFKYTSFLDMRNAFQRALNRCKIKINMSQGFNPHELVYYTDPDSLGIESKANYALIDCDCNPKILLNEFNRNAPTGLKILNCANIENRVNFNTTFKYAKYIVRSDEKINNEIFANILNKKEIIAKKEKNGEIKEVDIRSKINSLSLIDNFSYEMIITYGQEKLSPYLLIDYICNMLNTKRENLNIIKEDIFIIENNQLVNIDKVFFKK